MRAKLANVTTATIVITVITPETATLGLHTAADAAAAAAAKNYLPKLGQQ